MRVIKSGKEKTFITKYSSCGSDLEYTLEDVHKKKLEIGEINQITCPVCEEELWALLVTKEEVEQAQNDPRMFTCGQC